MALGAITRAYPHQRAPKKLLQIFFAKVMSRVCSYDLSTSQGSLSLYLSGELDKAVQRTGEAGRRRLNHHQLHPT